MSVLREPVRARVVVSVLSGRWAEVWPALLTRLEEALGPADIVSDLRAFDHTNYYESEMGAPLFRRLVSFERLVPQDGLADLKFMAMALERELALPDGRRRVNLDPGLVTQERLVLATGKNFTHRVYQGRRIWADLTLIWQGGAWKTLPWTFSDYATPWAKTVLTEIRRAHRRTLEAGRDENRACPRNDLAGKGPSNA